MDEFTALKLTDRVYWVGAIDWELRNFHGYNTSRGTTYNAYLILGEKPILVDTVKKPFFAEMRARITSVIDPSKIAYIVSNHAEMDHSGCLQQAIDIINPEKIFASKMGAVALQQHFQLNRVITTVGNNETIALGDSELTFIETRMLHWPDSMFSYLHKDGVLFSQDGFGMHLATSNLLVTDNEIGILRHEALKYYANILLPYSNVVAKLLGRFKELNLNIEMVVPDHGPIWNTKEKINWILDLWGKWSQQKSYRKALVVYDTMWNSTASMAHAIAEGFRELNVPVELLCLQAVHRSDVAAKLLEAGALLIGSPTLNQQMFPTVAEIICYLKGLKRKGLIGQAFGSYGWGGEAVKLIQKDLIEMQIDLIGEAINVKYVPKEEDLETCKNLGKDIAKIM